MSTRWFGGFTSKVLGIAVLAMLMLVPLAQVNALIGEREGRAQEAAAQIGRRWGMPQTVAGPVLVVPVRRVISQADGKPVTVEEHAFVLPDRLAATATLAPEHRRYGIFDAIVYSAELKLEGRFLASDLATLSQGGREPQWQRAQWRVPIADAHGIRRASPLRIGTRELAFGPDSDGIGGIAAVTAADDVGEFASRSGSDASLAFAFDLTLAGSERFALLPLARQTDAHVQAPWSSPGFDGAFLPATRRVDASSFDAQWQVLDLNRRIPQHWTEGEASGLSLADSAFGVALVQPVDAYQQNVRAGKYGVLFVALTFAAFFLFEVLRGARVHPVQYLMVGVGLCTFYVVLLALSEQIGFAAAYAVAAALVVLIVAGYAASILRRRSAGIGLGGLLALVYALLYGLVSSEDYALLMGACALLAAVAAAMYLTRRVDWYAGPAAPLESAA